MVQTPLTVSLVSITCLYGTSEITGSEMTQIGECEYSDSLTSVTSLDAMGSDSRNSSSGRNGRWSKGSKLVYCPGLIESLGRRRREHVGRIQCSDNGE